MRANIERLAEGKFEYEQVRLVIEEERIERTVYENEVVNGSFHISCPDNKKVKGIVYAGNRRVHCLNPQFIAKEAEIHYSYDSRGLTEGEKTEGEFVIVSSAGEFTLPFCFDVSKAYMESSLGVIKNLFHFANLARSSWQEAYKIFCKREFLSVIENTEKKLVSVYRGLTEGGITEAAMEEFLISIRKKDRLFVSLDKQQEVYENVTESFKKNLMLMKSGWGFMEVRITSDADFLIPEQTVVHSEDFVGSQYIFEYIIESSKLHAGKNFGRLIFETDYSRTEFTVEVSKGSTRELPKERILVRRHERELFEKYILFRGRKIGTKEWTRMSLELLEQLGSMGAQTPWHELMRVQLYLVEKRMDEADWILERFEQTRRLKNQNPELYGYYLYIQVLRKKEQASKAAEHIQSLLKKYPDSWILLWIFMNLNEELTKHPEQKYLKIKDFIKNYGSRSSILLMEAYLLVKHNPGYLNQADVFEMQLMSFALHHDLITKETAKQAGIVFSRCRGFQKQVFCILEKCYEISQSEECLQAICNILIKGNCTGEFAFSWYRRGIEKKLRITQLYEYYMYSIPDGYTELLPDGALKYFMYQNQLDYRKKALLYANIIAHREECPKVYKEYKKLMEQFVLEQLLKRHINEHLAVIYRDVLSEEVMNDELRQALADVMFTCRVTCKSPDIRQVFVYHKQMKKPGIYPVVDGTAYVLCCTQDAEVYLEDDKKNYYVAADHCTVRPLLSMEFCENLCKEMDNTAKLLYQCSKNEHFINQEDVELLLGFLAREDVSDRYREKMRYRLMLHFYKQYDMDALDKILQVMDERLLTKEQYEKYIELLIVRGMYKKAYTLICDRGSEHISPKKIVKMLSRMIAAREPEAEEELLALAFYVFENGKYDEIVLEYLTQYYNGSTKNMLQIWRAARRFEARVYDLPERLLAQVLFTGYYFDNVQEVFEACCREYAGALVIRAYIAQGAYQYLVKDMVVSESIFTCIQREYKNGEPLHDVCKLALLKYFSECGELSEEQLSVVQELLLEYFGRNIYMNFFGNFEERLLLPFLQTQKICVEYKTNPKYKVKIHYILEQPGNQNQNYMIEDMECTLEGIFVKEFVLFFGETLQYYITEEYQRSEQLTESRSITNAQVGISEKISKFGMLNDICVSNSLKDEQTLYSLMKKYALQENMAEHIFEPL